MEDQKKDIFINGKSKAFEIIQLLNSTEKSNILNKIQLKNPRIAEELMRNSYSFKDMAKLKDADLETIFPQVSAPILGVALRNLDVDIQRRVLSLAPREYAQKAFETLTGNLKDEVIHIKRARSKISEIIIGLIRVK